MHWSSSQYKNRTVKCPHWKYVLYEQGLYKIQSPAREKLKLALPVLIEQILTEFPIAE